MGQLIELKFMMVFLWLVAFFITDHFHGKINREELLVSPQKRILFAKGTVIIKKNAWLGEEWL